MMKSYYDPNTQIDEEENEDENENNDGKVMLFQ